MMSYIAGENTRVTLHKENGITLRLNVEEVYFSPRLSTERKRILNQVQDHEKMLCLFSGCGPYPILFAKYKDVQITSIEINPIGVQYQQENIQLNKIKPFTILQGDVKEILPRIKETYDRICMPLPKDAENFLEDVLPKTKKGSIIHMYDFVHEEQLINRQQEILDTLKKKGYYATSKITKTTQYAPRAYRICHDITIQDIKQA